MPRGRLPDEVRRTEHLTVPMTQGEMAMVEGVAKAWGRSKTAFVREVLLTGIQNLPMAPPLRPLV